MKFMDSNLIFQRLGLVELSELKSMKDNFFVK